MALYGAHAREHFSRAVLNRLQSDSSALGPHWQINGDNAEYYSVDEAWSELRQHASALSREELLALTCDIFGFTYELLSRTSHSGAESPSERRWSSSATSWDRIAVKSSPRLMHNGVEVVSQSTQTRAARGQFGRRGSEDNNSGIVTLHRPAGHSNNSPSDAGLSIASLSEARGTIHNFLSSGEFDEPTAATEGGKLAHFEVISELGKGSFGVVYLAVDHTETPYAIKTLYHGAHVKDDRDSPLSTSVEHASARSKDGCARPRRNREVDREIALMKKIRHKNIVSLHAVIQDPVNQQTHLVMQYIENGPIATLKQDGTCAPLPEADAISLMVQVSAGLEYLHRHGILHRDIKPENILIGRDRTAYLADFGVSSVIGDELSSGVSRFEGTLAFMAPEQIEDETAVARYGKEGDIWAFGITLFVLLFGELPFKGWNQPSLLRAILNNEAKVPDTPCAQAVSPAIQRLALRLLKKVPEDRMTLREFRRDPTVRKIVATTSTKDGAPAEQHGKPTSALPGEQSGKVAGREGEADPQTSPQRRLTSPGRSEDMTTPGSLSPRTPINTNLPSPTSAPHSASNLRSPPSVLGDRSESDTAKTEDDAMDDAEDKATGPSQRGSSSIGVDEAKALIQLIQSGGDAEGKPPTIPLNGLKRLNLLKELKRSSVSSPFSPTDSALESFPPLVEVSPEEAEEAVQVQQVTFGRRNSGASLGASGVHPIINIRTASFSGPHFNRASRSSVTNLSATAKPQDVVPSAEKEANSAGGSPLVPQSLPPRHASPTSSTVGSPKHTVTAPLPPPTQPVSPSSGGGEQAPGFASKMRSLVNSPDKAPLAGEC